MYEIETIEREEYVGTIHLDDCPSNPRENWESPGTLLVQLSDRYLAPSKADEQDWRYDKVREAWEHGRGAWHPNGVFCGTYHDPEKVTRYARAFLDAAAVEWWDDPCGGSRVVCLVFKDSDFTDPASAAKAVLAEYAAWAEGDVYGYTVTAPDGEEIDSCWGYYGDSELTYIRSLINDAIDSHVAARHAEHVSMYRELVNR